MIYTHGVINSCITHFQGGMSRRSARNVGQSAS